MGVSRDSWYAQRQVHTIQGIWEPAIACRNSECWHCPEPPCIPTGAEMPDQISALKDRKDQARAGHVPLL